MSDIIISTEIYSFDICDSIDTLHDDPVIQITVSQTKIKS